MKTGPLKLKQSAFGLLTVIAVLMLAIILPQRASAVSLKPSSVISDNTIKLKDIFDGLEHKAERVLGPAPLPGQEMVLNARTLMRIAIALDLNWRPASSGDQIVLSRAATMIDRTEIEDVIRNELVSEGVDGNYNLVIPNDMAQMILPHETPASVEVVSMDYRPDQDRFEALLVAPNKAAPIRQIKVIGTLERLVKVPVLRDTVQSGRILGMNDIDYMDIPAKRVKDDMILDAQDLVGMTPRRVLFAGQTIDDSEIEAPRIVGRGEIVTMVFQNGPLNLTAEGKALEFGSKGDIIRVVNTSSSQSVQAMVTGVRQVTVKSF